MAGDSPNGAVYQLWSPELRQFGPPPYMVSFWYNHGPTNSTLAVKEWDGVRLVTVWIMPGNTLPGKWREREIESGVVCAE